MRARSSSPVARSCATASFSSWFFFGLAKFTEGEALTIQPWVANSPFLSWLYTVICVQGGSNLIGVMELVIGVLLAVRPWWPRLSVIGSLGATIAFAISLSFLFTTPGLSPE